MHLDFAREEDTTKIFFIFFYIFYVPSDTISLLFVMANSYFSMWLTLTVLLLFSFRTFVDVFLFNRVTLLLICAINARRVLSVLFMKSLSV